MRIYVLTGSTLLALFLFGGCQRHSQSTPVAETGKSMATGALAAGKGAPEPQAAPAAAGTGRATGAAGIGDSTAPVVVLAPPPVPSADNMLAGGPAGVARGNFPPVVSVHISPPVPAPAPTGSTAVTGSVATLRPSIVPAIVPAQVNTGVTIGGTASGGSLSASSAGGSVRPGGLAGSPPGGLSTPGGGTTGATR